MSKQKANAFGGSSGVRKQRVGNRVSEEERRELGVEYEKKAHEGIKDECCGGKECSNEEIHEFEGHVGPERVWQKACEVSLREDNGRCGCSDTERRCGVWQYMFDGTGGACSHPCKRDKEFLCDKERRAFEDGKSCIPNEKKCNTVKDCLHNADDEAGCRIMPFLTDEQIKDTAVLTHPKTEFGQWGNLIEPAVTIGVAHVNERVVCKRVASETISKETATVFCRTMKENGPNTIGGFFPAEAEIFDSKTSDPIMSNVKCTGSERHIGICPHDTYSSECSQQDGAVIGCIDPDRIKLRDGKEESGKQGRLHFASANNDAAGKAICTTIFGSEFNRPEKGVPFSRRMINPDNWSTKPKWHFIIYCPYGVYDLGKCTVTPEFGPIRWIEILCAKCNADKLISIVQKITNTGTTESVIASLEDAKESLSEQCWDWYDCHMENPEYEEYCMVKKFINNALYTLKPAVAKGTTKLIREYIDYQKLIELNKLNVQFSEVKEGIENLGSALGEGLAEYFGNLANFDEKLAQADVAYSSGVWKTAKDNIERMNPDLEKLVDDVTNAAIATAKRQQLVLEWKTFFMASGILNQIKDFDISFVSDVIDHADEMKLAAANVESLKAVTGLLDEMKEQVTKIKQNYLKNELTFRHAKFLLRSDASADRLYVDRLKMFLEAYNNFSPAITLSGMAEYTSLVENLINKCCEIIAGGGGGDAIKEIEKNSCSNVEKKFEVMKAFYEDLGEQQIDIMDAYARMARAQTAKEGAEQLKNSVSNLKAKIKQEIVKKNIKIVLRAHKLLYIESYCDSISYQGYGKINSDCTYLKANPDASPDNLIARKEPAMCGSTRYKKDKVQKIPVSDSKVGGGYLNISALYDVDKDGNTNGYATFQIPDVQWLSDNNWMIHDPQNSGPFALNSIKLHLLPGTESKRATYDIRIKITGSKVGGKSYTFVREVRNKETNEVEYKDGMIIANTYTMNADRCAANNIEASYYDVPKCQGTPNAVCWNAGHDINEDAVHLPMLVGSLWVITLTSNAALKPLIIPEGYIYADVKMCSENRFIAARRREHTRRTAPCCSPAKFYDEKTASCKACPTGQQPFLWDRFCEACPPGYETSQDAYGCKKCPDDKEKENSGPGQCE